MLKTLVLAIISVLGLGNNVPQSVLDPQTLPGAFKREIAINGEVFLMAQNTSISTEIVTTTPELEIIAQCESNGKHFNSDGSVIRGKENPQDIGRYQINLDFHGKTAKEMKLNLFDETDNATYALWLYKTQGIKPWSASIKCWQDKIKKPPR